MNELLGRIEQLGYVVDDVHAAIAGWIRAGVGPFFVEEELTLPVMWYDGVVRSVSLCVARAVAGPIQIELIKPLDATPSPWLDFLANGDGAGAAHHVAFWTTEIERVVHELVRRGLAITMQGFIPHGAALRPVVAYLDAVDALGTTIEVAAQDEQRRQLNDAMRRGSHTFDGYRPVRSASELVTDPRTLAR